VTNDNSAAFLGTVNRSPIL